MNSKTLEQKCRVELEIFLDSTLACLCRSDEEFKKAWADFNVTLSNGVAFKLNRDARIAALKLGEAVVNAVGVKNASVKEVRDRSIEVLASVLKEEDDWENLNTPNLSANFLDGLVSTALAQYSYIAPCEIFDFADGENELVSEYVKVRLARDVVSSAQFPTEGKNWKIVAEDGFWPDDFALENHMKVFGTVWDISCEAPKDLVTDAARWMAEVFVSSVRIGLQPADYCLRPRIGQYEIEPFGEVRLVDRHLVYRDESVNFGGVRRAGTYKVDSAFKGRFEDDAFQEKLAQVLSPSSNSVGERLANSLGWAARARQASDASVRLLYFFTSIEALLTEQDSFAPVSDTVARYAGIIISKSPKSREPTYREVRELYGLRSHLVHRGKRTVHWLNANNIQSICENIQWVVWTNVDFAIKHRDLLAELKFASHGTEWPPAKEAG